MKFVLTAYHISQDVFMKNIQEIFNAFYWLVKMTRQRNVILSAGMNLLHIQWFSKKHIMTGSHELLEVLNHSHLKILICGLRHKLKDSNLLFLKVYHKKITKFMQNCIWTHNTWTSLSERTVIYQCTAYFEEWNNVEQDW